MWGLPRAALGAAPIDRGPHVPGVVTAADPSQAVADALVIGALYGIVFVKSLDNGASDLPRLEAIKTAVGGRYQIVCLRGTWRDGLGLIEMPANPWQFQTAWYIDPAGGNDITGDGSAARPVATVREWRRRAQGTAAGVSVVVNLLGDIPDTDEFPCLPMAPGSRLRVVGTLTRVETGIVAGVIAEDPSTNTPLQFSKAAGDFSAHVGRLVYFPERDSWGVITIDMAGGLHRAAILPPVAYADGWATWGTATPPQPGDHYEICTASRLPVIAYPNATILRSAGDESLIYTDCEFPGDVYAYTAIQAIGPVSLVRVGVARNDAYAVICGSFTLSCVSFGSLATIYDHVLQMTPGSVAWSLAAFGSNGHNVRLNLFQTVAWNIVGPVFCNGLSFCLYDGSGSVGNGGNIAVFNAKNDGLQLRASAYLDIHGGSRIYGSGNGGRGVRMSDGAKLFAASASLCCITGTLGDLWLGAANLMPPIGSSAGGTLPAAAPCGTWAQLFAAPFNGRAVNYDTLAGVFP